MRDPMRLKIAHSTRYDYGQPVPYGLQQLRLKPDSGSTQTIIKWDVSLEGAKREAAFRDQHGNQVELVSIEPGATAIDITSVGEIETRDTAGIVGPHDGVAPLWLYRQQTHRTRPGPATTALIQAFPDPDRNAVQRLHALTRYIGERVIYDTSATHSETTAESAVITGRGVCQDHTHIFIGIARALGFPARYVSGYLMMDDRDDQDASHAWAEAFVDDLGWVGFDVSNKISPDERYVRMATGQDYGEAAPISGFVFGGGKESMIVTLQVQQ
ncbi:MAG: transglutaminase [Hyphobacterium sp.]|nr:MAG: transglutaminase [Hyphobacterium sp.]